MSDAELDYDFWGKVERYDSMQVAACLACDLNPDRAYDLYLPAKVLAVVSLLEEHTRSNLTYAQRPVTRTALKTVVDKAGLKPKIFYPELRTAARNEPLSKADLNLIGALARLYWDETGDGTNNINQTQIIESLLTRFRGVYGLSKRTVQAKLSAALKALKDTQAR